MAPAEPQAESLPAGLLTNLADKENTNTEAQAKASNLNESDDFQVVDMEDEEMAAVAAAAGAVASSELMGPSLPAPKPDTNETRPSVSATQLLQNMDAKSLSAQLQSGNLTTGQYASHLGDSLIEMIINLRNENQNLVRALETNNEYVKERLSEFKRCQEEAKRRELQYAMEKAEFEHRARKLERQNGVLSERLKSLESKLRDMKVEVGESLAAANSSRASSVRDDERTELYPQLELGGESFANSALAGQQAATMQMDATSGELYNTDDGPNPSHSRAVDEQERAADDETGRRPSDPLRVAEMSRQELSKRFDADKAQFYALDDPMKQCDQLEKQLNDIGRRDYEICLLQQQLNIYRQDFRLERMAKLEAKIQIEKLKNDIDRLCLERVQDQRRGQQEAAGGVRFEPTTTDAGHSAEPNLIGKLGHHLGKKAVRSAAKAAKYAAKQAHLEEKAAAAMARAAAAKAAATSHFTVPKTADLGHHQQQQQQQQQQHEQQPMPDGQAGSGQRHHRGHHRHSSHGRPAGSRGGIRSEVMNDLLSTANKAMLTGYKMASTHVNLALDKLSQYEQQQASQLDPSNKTPIQTQATATKRSNEPSAPPMEPPSID